MPRKKIGIVVTRDAPDSGKVKATFQGKIRRGEINIITMPNGYVKYHFEGAKGFYTPFFGIIFRTLRNLKVYDSTVVKVFVDM